VILQKSYSVLPFGFFNFKNGKRKEKNPFSIQYNPEKNQKRKKHFIALSD